MGIHQRIVPFVGFIIVIEFPLVEIPVNLYLVNDGLEYFLRFFVSAIDKVGNIYRIAPFE